jgi:hypothetical protein
MEMWEQDYYGGLVIYEGSLTAGQQEILKSLQGAVASELSLNLSLQKIDIASEKRTAKKLLGKNIPEQLPALVLWHPRQMGYAPPFWSGSLSVPVIDQIMQSPRLREIGDHLLRGVPVVWVLVQSGNREKDHDAVDLLAQELQMAKTEILGDPSFQPHFEHISDTTDLFPLVSIPRSTHMEEQVLLSMLLRFYPGLEEIDEPVLFPVFGRGRALGALAGDEIEAQNIQSIIAFLLNPCSCQVKMANPGFDLLMDGDWNSILARYGQATLRPLMASIMPDTTLDEEYTDLVELTGGNTSLFSSRILSTTGIIIGAVILLTLLAGILIVLRR